MIKETIAKVATQLGAAMSVISGLTLSEWGVIVGMAVGIAGLGASQYWQWRRYRLEKRVALARLKHGDDLLCADSQQQP